MWKTHPPVIHSSSEILLDRPYEGALFRETGSSFTRPSGKQNQGPLNHLALLSSWHKITLSFYLHAILFCPWMLLPWLFFLHGHILGGRPGFIALLLLVHYGAWGCFNSQRVKGTYLMLIDRLIVRAHGLGKFLQRLGRRLISLVGDSSP